MPTKLSRFCQGVMEAAWLAAVCLVPLFFNIYSSRIFEPDKITILRSLAIFTLAAWVIKLIEEGGIHWSDKPKETSLIVYLWKYPLFAPVVGLVIVYCLATIFSVTPSISLFGSYQRLQGTYTTLSYIIIFFSIVTNLRTKRQVNRLLTTIILASLPISLYGLLQRYQIDPIPWGGDVSIRIASNMGNSIFVAAYLIMVFPLTVGRIIESFKEIIDDNEKTGEMYVGSIKQIIKATIYVFIAALQLIAIYMSGSRGPMLGLMAAIYFMGLLLSLYWHKRWMTFSIIGLAIIGAIFLAVFNLNKGPLDSLKTSPAIGRYGNLLNPESNSALVRQYIWEGTVKLVGTHDPLKFPDGRTDPFNFIRPIIGYGPEAMYVAYNQFYEPELGQVEKRNASPDRAHNETWDSIVITGIAGLVVYLSLFSSVFYYSLKWQGLILTKGNKYSFFACLIGGGMIGSIILIILRGVEFLGVGLPFGMILGVIVYLTIFAILRPTVTKETMRQNPYTLLLIFLCAATVGHFIEINFGIAIAATRTLFWTYTGVTLVVGYILQKREEALPVAEKDEKIIESVSTSPEKKKEKRSYGKQRRKTEGKWPPIIGNQPDWIRNAMIGGVVVGIILTTLGFDYITNASHSTSVISIIMNSLTKLVNKANVTSFGILSLIITSWLAGILLFSAEGEEHSEYKTWLKHLGLTATISAFIGLLFWLLHSISLAILAKFTPANQNDVLLQVNNISSLLTKYYLYLFIIILLVGFILPDVWPSRGSKNAVLASIVVPVSLVIVIIISNSSNLQVIGADITFKMAEPFTKQGQWQVATFLYKRSLELTPQEDHYYLFLGRSYLEQAKKTEAISEQDALVRQAENDLKVAQSINPLNTDHTANLARLYSWWAQKATDNPTRNDRAQRASDYYAAAVKLSPNNSTLWGEWASLFMQIIGQPQQALERLQHALELDAKYSYTLGLMGDYYLRLASTNEDMDAKKQALLTAADYYQNAVDVVKKTDQTSKASYLLSLGNVYIILSGLDPQNTDRAQIQQAIDTLISAIDAGISSNDQWKVQEAIAKLYVQLGDKSMAQYFANQALSSAPSSASTRLQELISQTMTLP
jgi:O-antigen ligase